MTNAEHKLEYLCSVLDRCGWTLGQHMDQDYLECHEQNITQIVNQYRQPDPCVNIPLESRTDAEALDTARARIRTLEYVLNDVKTKIKQMKIWEPSDF